MPYTRGRAERYKAVKQNAAKTTKSKGLKGRKEMSMKKMKKLAALFLAVVMVMAMGMTAMAAPDSASITIKNAAMDVKYKVYKIFDAERNDNGHMAYMLMNGETIMPEELAALGFEADRQGHITDAPTSLSKTDVEALINYVGLTWDETSKTYIGGNPVRTVDGNGGELVVDLGTNYGYYLVVSSTGAVVSINDTDPNAVIVDKNKSTPTVGDDAKTVSDNDVYIGQEIEYTLTFGTVNYVTEGFDQGTSLDTVSGNEPKQVAEYIITDDLPKGVTLKEVTSITVDGEPIDVIDFDKDGKITIPWTENGISKYANDAELVIKYTVTVNENIALGMADENKNEVTLTWNYADGTSGGGDGYKDTETISTYAMVLQKVDGEGHNLADAKFKITGYEVAGSAGMYKITNKIADTAQSTEMECDATGKLVIYGLAKTEDGSDENETYIITETTAPTGYNILAAPIELMAEKTATSTTTTYYDENGDVITTDTENADYSISEGANITQSIVNNQGTVLPSTGGIGTTIFYVVGGILVLGAGVLLITKKRMSAK